MAKALQRVPAFQFILSDDQFRAVGHMVLQWAHLEAEIDRQIGRLLRREEHQDKSVNFQARFATRINRWQDLTKESYKGRSNIIKQTAQVSNRALKIKRERDDICHGSIGSSGIFVKTGQGQVVARSKEAGQAAHIEDLACRIGDITVAALNLERALKRVASKSP